MNGFGDEIAKRAGRALIVGFIGVVALLVCAFLLGRYFA